ncbi:MAG: hypothetical protein ABJI96_21995 [Paracoccaceae bacterium]
MAKEKVPYVFTAMTTGVFVLTRQPIIAEGVNAVNDAIDPNYTVLKAVIRRTMKIPPLVLATDTVSPKQSVM